MIKLMIAEDIDVIREDFVEFLSSHDDIFVIGQARTGQEIVQVAQLNPPDIILMDIEMESINAGIKAAEQISSLGLPSKIIYLTAHDTQDMVLTAMATGAVDYVIKDSSYEEIEKHIRAAAAGHPLMEGVAQQVILQEYQRLRHTEKGLLYFINHLSQLTQSEREIIGFLLQGYKVADIAKARVVEVATVKTQITAILKKFGVKRSVEIVRIIQGLGLEHLFN